MMGRRRVGFPIPHLLPESYPAKLGRRQIGKDQSRLLTIATTLLDQGNEFTVSGEIDEKE